MSAESARYWRHVNSEIGHRDREAGRSGGVCGNPVAQTTAAEENKLAVFSNLASVQAARKEKSSLNIAYDCEYQSIGLKHRIILSYQFAVYIKDAEILEVVFITKRYKEDNRLYLRTCLGAILDLLRLQFEFEYLNYAIS